METTNSTPPSRWRRLSGPLRIGIVAALLGIALAVVGIARGNVPLNPLSIFLALLISGGSWGLVAWAIATAASDVDADLLEAEAEAEADAMSVSPDQTPAPESQEPPS